MVEQDKLEAFISSAARVSTRHMTLPILQYVLLEVKNNSLVIRATNLEVGVEGEIPAIVKEGGSVAVQTQTLLQIISLLQTKKITLKEENNTLVVETPSSKTKLNTISVSEFPTIPKIKTGSQNINKTLFSIGIKTAAFAASQTSIKPELGSVYIYQKKEHTLTFVATDSFRLMEKVVPQKGVVLQNPLLIPHKNALEFARVCDVFEGEPILLVDENQCALQFPNFYITSRLVNGSFPDYEGIIPKEYSTHTTLLTNDLGGAFKKTGVFLNKFMQVTLAATKTSLIVRAQSGDVGETEEVIPASTDGDDIKLSFNQRYIQEALPHIIDDSIILSFAGVGRPLVINGVHDKTLRYLVMPMNK